MGAWLGAGSTTSMPLLSGRVVDIAAVLSRALTGGIDPASPHYYDTRQPFCGCPT
jgi:hypothetical protein